MPLKTEALVGLANDCQNDVDEVLTGNIRHGQRIKLLGSRS